MSINAVSSVSTTAAQATVKAQLERDQLKLEADLKAQATAAQLAADNAAIANDRLVLAQAAGSVLDTFA